NGRHRSAALAHEDISSGFLFALETAQGAKFDAGQWVDGRDPILKSIDVQAAMDKINLLPAQRAQFGCSQAVPECYQDHGGITMPVPIVSRRLHERTRIGYRLAVTPAATWKPDGRYLWRKKKRRRLRESSTTCHNSTCVHLRMKMDSSL